MGPRVPRIIALCVAAIVILAVVALAPFVLGALLVLADQPHSCGGA
jgi:hypothetical protein